MKSFQDIIIDKRSDYITYWKWYDIKSVNAFWRTFNIFDHDTWRMVYQWNIKSKSEAIKFIENFLLNPDSPYVRKFN